MPRTHGIGPQQPATTTRTTATPSFRSSHITEVVTLEDVFAAYYDCRRHKRSKRSAVEYEMRYELNNLELWRELNNQTYTPATSIVFCVTQPKLREVFAADFRDRVVHHLFINKILPTIEARLTPCACSCRKGMGTLYGIRRVLKSMSNHSDGWYLKFDIQSFFMSINKEILLRLTEEVVKKAAKENTGWWLWLAKTIIMHQPEKDCVKHGDIHLWEKLPADKSLFGIDDNTGLPIGNLPSQVLTLLYMDDFCKMIVKEIGNSEDFTMYADDGVIVCDSKRKLLELLPKMRTYLKDERRLALHPRKITIQRVRSGVTFIGYLVKDGILKPGRRTIHNAISVAKWWSRLKNPAYEDKVGLRARINSYCGLMRHTKSYKIRRKMWRNLKNYKGIISMNKYSKIKLS